jgi:hypothetical protein
MKPQESEANGPSCNPMSAEEAEAKLDEGAFGIALQAAMQTVSFGQYSSDADLRAAEIDHDLRYARTLISTYLAALPDVPVAWRYRLKHPNSHWQITDQKPEGWSWKDWDVVPLFTHPASEGCPTQFDMVAHLARQAAWSEKTFGPGARTAGVVDHIRKELLEIEADPGDLKEWIDVTILALDGAWRSGASPAEIMEAIVAKQTKNEGRVWPDWRTSDPNKAIEHDRAHDAPAPSIPEGE